MIDNTTLNLSDLDLEFVATNAGKKKSLLNPDRSLVRYQILEVITRIALHKYISCNILISWIGTNTLAGSLKDTR